MKKILTLLVVLAMLLAMAACAAQSPDDTVPPATSSTYIPGGLGTKTDNSAQPSGEVPATAATDPPASHFSAAAGTSLDALREEINHVRAVFGVAYIGSFHAAEMSFEEWLPEVAGSLLDLYPFIQEIGEDRIIGTNGHLYCILAGDYESTISASTLSGEVLYQGQDGDPILIFCSRDWEGMIADTVITVTTPDGEEYAWEACLDGSNYPQLLIASDLRLLSWDFTPLPTHDFRLDSWLVDGWLGPTPTGLAGTDVLEGMDWWISTWDGSVRYCLSFCPNSGHNYDGEAILECYYGTDTTLQAEWQGWWRLETTPGQSSRLSLDLMLLNGEDKASFEHAAVVSEYFRVLISPSGDYLLLAIENDETVLPIFPDGSHAVELTLSVG